MRRTAIGEVRPRPPTWTSPIAGRSLNIAVFDLSGRRIRLLESGQATLGRHALEWNLSATTGERVRSGLYFVRFQLGDTRITKSLLIR